MACASPGGTHTQATRRSDIISKPENQSKAANPRPDTFGNCPILTCIHVFTSVRNVSYLRLESLFASWPSDYTRLYPFSIPNISMCLARGKSTCYKHTPVRAYVFFSPERFTVHVHVVHSIINLPLAVGLVISASHRIQERHRHLHVLFDIISHMHGKLENIQMANFNTLIIIQC